MPFKGGCTTVPAAIGLRLSSPRNLVNLSLFYCHFKLTLELAKPVVMTVWAADSDILLLLSHRHPFPNWRENVQ